MQISPTSPCFSRLARRPSTCHPASFFSSLSYFRPLMLPLTCTVSMVFRLPETPVQLSMVTRSVYRLLHTWVLFPPVCVEENEERRAAFQVYPPVLQLCGSLSRISQQLYRRVGFQIYSQLPFVFLTTLNTW